MTEKRLDLYQVFCYRSRNGEYTKTKHIWAHSEEEALGLAGENGLVVPYSKSEKERWMKIIAKP